MPVSIVVGGQFGSEGKGKVAAWLATEMRAPVVARCGGSNSGHTVHDDAGRQQIFRQLPTACLNGFSTCVLAAGTYIDLDVLKEEIGRSGIQAPRLRIDPHAVIITDEDKAQEARDGLVDAIGSTGSGTGAAVMNRLRRGKNVLFAKDIPELAAFLEDTKALFSRHLLRNDRVIIEGTQGYGLSVLHSAHYPFVTSRDTTAAGFLSECGISPRFVDDICLVIRTFPIRVAGHSGPLPNETTWSQIAQTAGLDRDFVERSSVTNKVRRVGEFDPAIVIKSIAVNSPTRIFLNHLDYVAAKDRQQFSRWVADGIGTNVDFFGLGPTSIVPCAQAEHSKIQAV